MSKAFETSYNVAIVGAGPAGSSAAIRLANAGLRVLLVEQKKFPREKLCGEFISPECLSHFWDLGVMPEISAAGGTDLTETIFFARNGKGVAVQSEWLGSAGTLALGLSRAEMDFLLLERARGAGVDVREEINASILKSDRKVVGLKIREKTGAETEMYAELTVDATGRTRSLARQFYKEIPKKKPADFVAFKTHLRGASVAPGVCEIYAYNGGYGGCNRVENDLYNLCFIASVEDTKRLGSNAERVMREVVFTNKRARDSMQNATVSKPWHAVPIERFGRGELVPVKGLITIGDAAAFIDPFTGSGILLSLESAKIAAASIVRNFNDGGNFSDLAVDYKENYSNVFDTRLKVCSMLRHVAFVPFLAEATISFLSISVGLRRWVARATR
ncbi:MAG: NAD(P)/FAD-dependent oxidoreductase [Pyrinomonadaceae bacterium]